MSGEVQLRPFRAEDFDAMWAGRGEGSAPVPCAVTREDRESRP